MKYIKTVLIFNKILLISAATTSPYLDPYNLTDVSECKVSHLGLDFLGAVGKTESGVRCQAWTAKNPLHAIDPSYTDDKFSDFSKVLAKNYCRNPSRDPTGPWCYTMAPDNIYETCGIPLCIYKDCRITGPGMEYAGSVKKTVTGKKCLKWDKKRPKVRVYNEVFEIKKLHKTFFPDESASYAKKHCRNPDADIGGPWCFVEGVNRKEVEREYCDVPFCQSEVCAVLIRDYQKYTHYTRFPETLTNFSFGIKLWHPDSYLNASARLVLSLFALPLTSTEMNSLGTGIEIYISNNRSGLTSGNIGAVEYEDITDLIKAHEFTYFSVTWWHGIVTLFVEGRKNPIFMADYKGKNTLMGHKANQFYYYAARSTDVVWSFPFCEESEQCDLHTTTGADFQRYYPTRETALGQDISLYLRAFRSAYIKLVVSPVIEYPSIKIMLSRSDNYTRVEYQEHSKGPTVTLKDTLAENLLKYWKWQEFTLAIFMGQLQIYVLKEGTIFPILLVEHEVFKKMRWFSPGSENSVAQWTFFCMPPAEAAPPPAYPPECALHKKEPMYNGTQDLTSDGIPCLPWAGNGLIPVNEVDKIFNETDKYEAWNYCRDPKDEQKGTFCYTISQDPDDIDRPVKKEYCHIRKCKSAECKIAGTGNDYIGKTTTTRSNRTCQHWVSPAMLRLLDTPPENTTNETEISGNVQVRSLGYSKLAKGNYSESELIQHLINLRKLFDEMQCTDTWKCLRELYGPDEIVRRRSVHVNIEDEAETLNTIALEGSNATSNSEMLNNIEMITKSNDISNPIPLTEESASSSTNLEIDYFDNEITAEIVTESEMEYASSINFTNGVNLTQNISDAATYLNVSRNPPHKEEVAMLANNPAEIKSIERQLGEDEETQTSKYDYVYNHTVDESLLNQTLFADIDLKKIKNYCRNPSRDLAGSWCYTEDPEVPIDICNVRDCDKIEECTIFLSGDGRGRRIYILPQWKEAGYHGGLRFAVKQWNPDLVTGLAFDFWPFTGVVNMRLEIGAENNERIILYYDTEKVKEKSMPHVIGSGKWENFWLQIRTGEIILGFHGVPTPLFEWTHPNASDAMNPVYLLMSTINGYPLGMSFNCDECHTEITTTKEWSKIYPIGLWMEEQPHHKSFTLHVRGTGSILIPLYLMPNSDQHYSIGITHRGGMIFLYKHIYGLGSTLKTTYTSGFNITENSWTTLEISFSQYRLNITSNGTLLMKYKSKIPMLFYWFSIGAENGWITWSANCESLDIDGYPLDGGWSKWSPWICTVSCGGGTGYRTRTCSNPRPNIFGRLCDGSPTSTGTCNEFECGDVSADTMELIREHLRSNHTSFVVKEKDHVKIENNPTILSKVAVESPDAYYEWTLNGVFINPEPGRLEFVGDDVVIRKAKPSDSGVYVCMLFRINKERLVLHVVSLAVIAKKIQIDTRATRKVTLSSNAVVLAYIYTSLKQRWDLNDTTYLDHGTSTLAAIDHEVLSPVNESHTGEWRCVIEQADLHFTWVTNIVKIRVQGAPNFFTNIREDQLTAPLFSWLKTDANVAIALVFIVVLVFGLVAFGLFAYFKWGRLPELTNISKVKNRRFQK